MDPRAVFERLFGSGDSTDPQTRRARLQTERSILDSVNGDLQRLQRRLGASDRTKIGDYLDAVRDLERARERWRETRLGGRQSARRV